MDGWNKFQTSFATLNIGQSANKFAKGFQSSVQATKERLGQVSADEITELPQGKSYLLHAPMGTHVVLLRITKVYETETYDYPTQIQESISELGTSIGYNITNFAAANLKGTNLPAPSPTAPPEHQHKTLPHALGRAATQAAAVLKTSTSNEENNKLGKAMQEYAGAWEKIADARVIQDGTIQQNYLQHWQTTLSTSLQVAMKARQAVRVSRLELDAAKQTLKNAGPAKQEAARIDVENAEDDLVQKTEVAITLMKTVLENPEPLKNLNELAKAQLIFYATAAEALSSVQGEIEELSVAAEGEYRKSRDH
ncbi:hypothetical protein EUX98_g8869 [Antrodiella citrinella]|uniref:BAR domain-containing protein n=1 Tax=Antrodiella citrinella TaxID=2447956 RepID=A0A4S4M343_9APHY|nr:hypothetical protein EUX98_g8869 [Antrodiella citrinella]